MRWPACLFLFFAALPEIPAQERTDAAAAVAIAEAFVRAEGYTDVPPTLPPERLTPESLNRLPREDWPAGRCGTLHPRAIGYRRGSRGDKEGWSVIFYCRKAEMKPKVFGQVLQMDRFGQKLQMLHSHSAFAGFTAAHPRPRK